MRTVLKITRKTNANDDDDDDDMTSKSKYYQYLSQHFNYQCPHNLTAITLQLFSQFSVAQADISSVSTQVATSLQLLINLRLRETI